MAVAAPEGCRFHLYLTELQMNQKDAALDTAFTNKGIPDIYVRTNVASSNRENNILAGNVTPDTELISSDILAKIHVTKGADYINYYATTEREAMCMINSSTIGGVVFRLTDFSGRSLSSTDVGITPGTFTPPAGKGSFSCTLRLDIVRYQNVEHLDLKPDGYLAPPRLVTAQIPTYT